MAGVRTVLWVGRGERFAADRVAEAPLLDVVWEREPRDAARLALREFDAVVLDAARADAALEGLAHLGRAGVPVLVRVDPHEVHRAPELERAGASDVIPAPPDLDGHREIFERLERLPRNPARRGRTNRPRVRPHVHGIVGSSPEMHEVYALIDVASRSHATVLVTGETGTGKELVARAIHAAGPRGRAPFVGLNCAAFPETLLEAELFGHARGAFTGADRDRAGLIEEAQGGTLFLDEVGETSGPFQAKLLRVLQEREVRRLGDARTRRVDVRVVAATNRDLLREADRGDFRRDLYYRLAVFPIQIPPLRKRVGDIVPLAEHFLATFGEREGRPGVRLSPEAGRLLQSHLWPGNVRELENEVHRALTLAEAGDTLTPDHFSERVAGILEPIEPNLRPGETLRETLERIEAWLLRRALSRNGNRRAATARQLGITREGLYKKMKRFGIE
jgi:DNA-binding NtrC family response regulator